MNDRVLAETARSYLRMISWANLVSRFPSGLAYPLIGKIAESMSPLLPRAEVFLSYLQVLGIPESRRVGLWRDVLRQHGMFLVNHYYHERHMCRFSGRVDHDADNWQRFLSQPGPALVLSCHHDFYHSLLVLAGMLGKRVYFVAAPEDSGELSHWLLPYIRQQHNVCSAYFNGGSYLFYDRMAEVHKAFDVGGTVFSMHDFHAPNRWAKRVHLGNWCYEVPAGTLEIALERGVPVYFGVLLWDRDTACYRPDFSRLDLDSSDLLGSYAAAMRCLIARYPTAWHGWQWVEDFKKLTVISLD